MTIDLRTYDLIADILTYSNIVPLTFSWVKVKIPSYLLPLRILFIISLISSVSKDFIAEIFNNNIFIGVIYITIEFALLSRIYWLETSNPTKKRIIKLSSITIVIFAIINLIFIQGFFQQNSYTRSIVSFSIICYSIMYFWEMINGLEVENLYKHPMFWISCGILIFSSASFILFLFSGYLFSKEDFGPYMTFWSFKNIIGIIRNFLFAYAFWLNFKMSRAPA